MLLGDAVHPMMPNLGQGGCQAIEDAYELTRALREACGDSGAAPKDAADTRTALGAFERRRKPRAAAVSLLSRLASDLIINFFDTPWSPHDQKGQVRTRLRVFERAPTRPNAPRRAGRGA